MNSTQLLNEIKKQLELLKHKCYEKNSFKSGYLLGYAKALQLQQTGVSSSDFRIVEYKDHFRVQKKYTEDTYFHFFGLELWVNGKKDNWNTILKNKTFLGIRNWGETENYQFKTKEECLEWISDYNKYPVYHYC